MKKKTFFLAITKDMEFYKCFIDNLNHLNYRVILFKPDNSFFNRKINFLKLFFTTIFLENDKAKALVIRPDLFSSKFVKKLTKKINNNRAYQWDGLPRYPNVIPLILFFKKFYVFDYNDTLKYENVYQLNNFYFDCYSEILKKTVLEYDVYYVGSYDSRINKVIEVCDILHQLGLKLYIKIPCIGANAKSLEKYSYIDTRKINRTYKENLLNVFKSKILLDFSHDKLHEGLSFRIFEALGYSKKIITTNRIVKERDFYSENNILVLEKTSDMKNEMQNFISNKDEYIRSKNHANYGFSNWLVNIF